MADFGRVLAVLFVNYTTLIYYGNMDSDLVHRLKYGFYYAVLGVVGAAALPTWDRIRDIRDENRRAEATQKLAADTASKRRVEGKVTFEAGKGRQKTAFSKAQPNPSNVTQTKEADTKVASAPSPYPRDMGKEFFLTNKALAPGPGPRIGNLKKRAQEVSDIFQHALAVATEYHPGNFGIVKNLVGSESSFNRYARSETDALGAGQFVPGTRRMMAWRCQHKFTPYFQNLVKDNLEVYYNKDKKGNPTGSARYRIKEGGSMKAIDEIATDPLSSIIMTHDYLIIATTEGEKDLKQRIAAKLAELEKPENEKEATPERMERMRAHLKRRMNATDGKTFYMAGPEGGAELLAAYADTKLLNQAAKSHTPSFISYWNPHVFWNDGKARSVNGYYEYMVKKVGTEIIMLQSKAPSNIPSPSL